jgi:hypothetical protein
MTQYDKLTLDDLKRRQAQVKDQILDSAHAISQVILRDAPRWIEREARKRFLDHPDFASQMPDDALANFKKDVHDAAALATEQLTASLAAPDLWLIRANPPEARKSLEGHPTAWPALQQVAAALANTLSRYNVPRDPDADAGQPYLLTYRSPMYFVDGVYCPALIETFWARVDEHNALLDALDSRQAATSRQVLEQRWDRA